MYIPLGELLPKGYLKPKRLPKGQPRGFCGLKSTSQNPGLGGSYQPRAG